MEKIRHRRRPGDEGEWRRATACFYCDVPLREVVPDAPTLDDTRTRDHLIVKGADGRDPNGRIVGACHLCNTLRGRLPAGKFISASKTHIVPYRYDLPALSQYLKGRSRHAWANIVDRMIARQAETPVP